MKQITVTIYEFYELSEKAKDRVRYDLESVFGYSWNTDALNSMKALAAHFEARVRDYEIAWDNSSYSSMKFAHIQDADDFDTPEDFAAWLKGKIEALGTYDPETLKGNGDCILTGYSADEDAIDGLRHAYLRENVTDLQALLQAAFKSWLKACQEDYRYQYSDEGLGETCDANDYRFYDDGRMVESKYTK